MTQAKHTPGPWFDCPAIFSDCGYPSSIKAVRTGASVALIISDNPQDARLIAAAPELLAALEQCLPIIDAHRRAALGEGDIAAMNARAAIAKAKGE